MQTYILPKTISPFYSGTKRFPRKIKKKYHSSVFIHKWATNDQKAWRILWIKNPKYVDYLISKVCENEEATKRRLV